LFADLPARGRDLGFAAQFALLASLFAAAATSLPAGAEDSEAEALRLADQTMENTAHAGDWRNFAELALGAARSRSPGSWRDERRVALDLRFDGVLSPQWRAVFSDRLDASWPEQGGGDEAVNTMKEAYLSVRFMPDALLDFGRVNARQGSAMGYNPTDYLRRGAVRSVVSIDPASLKENRQGSVMLRGQRLWEGGSASALYSPRIESQANSDGLSLDWGATNDRDRALFAIAHKLGATLSSQFLVFQEERRATQFGLNLNGLVNDATVAYLEWSGGRGPAHLSEALHRVGDEAWRNRIACGLTYTTTDKVTITGEYQYDGAAMERRAWRQLRAGPLPLYGLYRDWVWRAQELPTRRALFLRGVWQDAIIHRLDLGAMYNLDLIDSSRRTWIEARFRSERTDYALQWQNSRGSGLSNYGALPDSVRWQLSVRYFF